MKDVKIHFILVVLLSTAVIYSSAQAQDYQISWYTIDGGGGASSGGPYALTGTIGQPDAAYSAGSGYELLGGFWPGGPLCFVDFESFARLAEYWADESCDESNNFCDGADFEPDGDVDLVDLGLFVDEWLCYCPQGWPLK
jgi:hypothetical protein